MSMPRLRAALAIAAIVLAPLASRAWAEDPQGPHAKAILAITGMTWPQGWPPKVKAALGGPKGVQKVEINFEKKLATVEYEPGKTTLGDLMASLMRTNQYTATLSEAIRTSQVVDEVTFAVCTDLATYKPEGKGAIIVNAVGPESFDAKKMNWTVTGDEGLEIKPEGANLMFTVKKGITKPELLVHVKITYDGPKGKVDLDLPGVVIVSKDWLTPTSIARKRLSQSRLRAESTIPM